MERARIVVDTRGGENERIRQSFDGTAERTDCGVTLRYRETGENGMEGQVEIRARAGEIAIERCGSVTMTQRLIPGVPTVFTYSTPHGDFDVRVDTGRMHTEFKQNRGRLWAEFTQRLGGEPEKRTVEIRYRVEKDGDPCSLS